MPSHIRPRRKALYTIGMVALAVGFLLFLSTFVSFFLDFGSPDMAPAPDLYPTMGFHRSLDAAASNGRALGLRALLGMVLMIAGGVTMRIAVLGAAGSGLVLDPRKAREDLEPFSRMAGGMLRDALDEAGMDRAAAVERVIMLKCRHCSTLNEADSKFCQECGRQI